MRFEVPQFIEIEDKIFGPLTWRQFLYLGGGIGMAVVLFFSTNLIVFILIGLPIAALAGALAFYPVNNRPFSYFLEAAFNYFMKQMSGKNLYLWRKQGDIVYKQKSDADQAAPAVLRNPVKKDIASIARRLELEALQKQES